MNVARSGNPFSAECLHPERGTFLFAPETSVESLLARLRENRWCGEIVGPHGTGKSTLLCELVTSIREERRVVQVRMLPNSRKLAKVELPSEQGLLVVDGFEQLSKLRQRLIRWRCRFGGCGLLVTSHASVGLPTLIRTQVDEKLAQRIVRRLCRGWPQLVTTADVQIAYRRFQPNLRDMLFALYDVYEARRREVRV